MRLRDAYLAWHRMANAHFERLGVTADQFVVLSLLAEGEGVTQRELVERASSDANTIGEMLTRLEKKQLVRRQPHPKDGRARCVFLTPRGRKTQVQLLTSWEGQIQTMGKVFRPKELEVLKDLLGRISDAVAVSREEAGGAVA
jgi:DNA-binding MarR family transcriptional regulator